MGHKAKDSKSAAILDEIDQHILQILNEDGRISYTDIAKEIGLSRVATQLRINNLVQTGVIERFTAVVNPAKIGISVSAFFNVEVEPKYLQRVASILATEPAVTSLYHMTGPSKLHMHGLFKNNQEMAEFMKEKLYPLPGIMSVDSQLLIQRYKSRMGMKL